MIGFEFVVSGELGTGTCWGCRPGCRIGLRAGSCCGLGSSLGRSSIVESEEFGRWFDRRGTLGHRGKGFDLVVVAFVFFGIFAAQGCNLAVAADSIVAAGRRGIVGMLADVFESWAVAAVGIVVFVAVVG